MAETLFPQTTLVGKYKLVTGGGVTVNVPLSLETPDEAVIVTPTLLHCGVLVIGTCADPLPAGTVTWEGTEATWGLLLPRLTGQPAGGAGAPRVTAAVALDPPGAAGG